MFNRREFLTSIGIGATLLAGCIGGDDGDNSTEPTETEPESTDTEEQGIGADDPTIELRASVENWGNTPETDIEAVWEGAAGTEEDTSFGNGDMSVELPGDATYVEAEATARGQWGETGNIHLELVVNGEVIAEDEGRGTNSASASVEGRTQ